MQPISTHAGEVMYFGCVCFRGELGFLNCDDICMCVMNKQLELLEFVFDSCSIMRFLSLLPLGLFPCAMSVVVWVRLWSVGEVVMVPYVDAVVAVTLMRVLFVLYLCMLRECEGDGNGGVGGG